MRILPYFNSQPQVQKVQHRERTERPAQAAAPAETFRLPEETRTESPSAVSEDRFIPASPVTGVVYSLSTEARARLDAIDTAAPEARTAGVVKSGQYGFYRLDGRLGETTPAVKGDKLDLMS